MPPYLTTDHICCNSRTRLLYLSPISQMRCVIRFMYKAHIITPNALQRYSVFDTDQISGKPMFKKYQRRGMVHDTARHHSHRIHIVTCDRTH